MASKRLSELLLAQTQSDHLSGLPKRKKRRSEQLSVNQSVQFWLLGRI